MSSKIEITKVCQHCGNEFIAKTTVTKFCSHPCAAKNYKQRKKAEKLNEVKTPTVQKTDFNLSQLNNKEYLSIADTCQLLGASRMTIYRQTKNGNINAVKLGRRTIIKKSDIEKLFAS
ncbi:MAG: helix-turn-helix domain-containing protein [Bacteroidetes bacterium]|nr:helix-turn-helix domain-containing protein [Bacteroidota bacterium]